MRGRGGGGDCLVRGGILLENGGIFYAGRGCVFGATSVSPPPPFPLSTTVCGTTVITDRYPRLAFSHRPSCIFVGPLPFPLLSGAKSLLAWTNNVRSRLAVTLSRLLLGCSSSFLLLLFFSSFFFFFCVWPGRRRLMQIDTRRRRRRRGRKRRSRRRLYVCLLKAYSPANRTGSPQGFRF